MNQLEFKKAEKSGIWLRMGICAPSGAGKTWTALTIATDLAKKIDSRVAVIDSERGSAKKYSDYFDFDVVELESFEVENYIAGMNLAEKLKYRVIVIDSITHAWAGIGGILDKQAEVTKKSRSQNSYTAWRDVTPVHNRFINSMLSYHGHLITTMRTKTEYIIEDDGNGKKRPVKVGMAPIQREGMEYEFDIVGDMDLEHNFSISKTRCRDIDGKVFHKPGTVDQSLIPALLNWVGEGASKPDKKAYITQEQKDDIELIKIRMCSNEKYGIDDSKWDMLLKKRGVDSVEELTGEQANEFITSSNMYMLTKGIEMLEAEHYPVKTAVVSARKKHLGVTELNKGNVEDLEAYLKHLNNKEK